MPTASTNARRVVADADRPVGEQHLKAALLKRQVHMKSAIKLQSLVIIFAAAAALGGCVTPLTRTGETQTVVAPDAQHAGLPPDFSAMLLDLPSDVAVLKIEARDLPVVTLGEAGQLRPGVRVAAIGAPFGLKNSITAGS